MNITFGKSSARGKSKFLKISACSSLKIKIIIITIKKSSSHTHQPMKTDENGSLHNVTSDKSCVGN